MSDAADKIPLWEKKLKKDKKKLDDKKNTIYNVKVSVGDGYGQLNPNDFEMGARKKSHSSVKMIKSKGVKSVAGKVKKKGAKKTVKKTTKRKTTKKRK